MESVSKSQSDFYALKFKKEANIPAAQSKPSNLPGSSFFPHFCMKPDPLITKTEQRLNWLPSTKQ